MRRISIHADVAGQLCAHDVAVCAQSPVAELLPALVDLVGQARDGVRRELRTATGQVLDESMSLTDNGIHDGDVVTLSAGYEPTVGLLRVDPVRQVAGASSEGIDTARVIEVGWSWLVLVLAGALIWAGVHASPVGAAGAAVCCALATSWRAVVTDSSVLAVSGALTAGAAGFVVVPTGVVAASVLLGAAVVFAVSVGLTRLVPAATAALTATGSAAALIATAAAVAAIGMFGDASAGAVLTVGAIGLLVIAPRLAAPLVEIPVAAQRFLTGLVVGAAAAAAIGGTLVAAAARSAPTIAFLGVTALLLLVRGRTHVDAGRRIALTVGGLAHATTVLIVVAVAFPAWLPWVAVGVVGLIAAAAAARPTPALMRAVDGIDYLCAALLIPLACWTIGVYAVVRDWVFT